VKLVFLLKQPPLCVFIVLTIAFTMVLTQACSVSPTATTLTPPITHEIISGKTTTITLNTTNANQHYILMPGGPYASKRFDVAHNVQLIAADDQTIYAITDLPDQKTGSDLLILDFKHPAPKLISRYRLTDSVNSLRLMGATLLLGMKNSGLIALDISNPNNIKQDAHITREQSITDIHVTHHQVYALSNQQQILVFNRVNRDDQPALQFDKTLRFSGRANSIAVSNDRLYITGPDTGLRAFNLHNPQQPVDQHPLQGQGKQMHIANNTLYVAGGTEGLVIFDISDPDKLTWAGSHNKLDSVDKTVMLNDSLVALDSLKRIATLNISRLSLPITGSFYKPANSIRDIASHQNQLYLATGSSIEQVYVPQKPQWQISNEGINQGGTRRAFIRDNIAYVADWFSGLHLYDISIPHFPRHLSNHHTPGSSKGVVVNGKYAYVGDDDHGLQIINISNPREPKWVSELMSTGLAYTLKMVGNLIYLADHRGGLHIIDISNARQPSIIGSVDTPGKSWAVDVVDNIAYIADDTSGLLIFDVSNPTAPQQISQFNPQGYAEDVLIKDNIAYVSFFDKGLYLLDISDPQNPRQISQLDIPGNARSITLSNGYAFIAGWESGLQIVDVSNINAPHIVASYDTNGSAWGVDIHQGYAYVWDWWGGVKVININNPQRPQLAGKYHTRGDIKQLRIKNNYIYTANGAGGVQVFDINNALNPIWVTGSDSPDDVVDIWPDADFAYTANGGNGVEVFDISNPFYIKQQGHIETPGNAYLVRAHQQIIYIADSEAGLLVIDAHQPAHPIQLAQYPMTINDLWLSEDTLFVATAKQGLLRFSLRPDGTLTKQKTTPHLLQQHPISQHSFNQQRNIRHVRSNAGYVFASVDNVGVYILQETSLLAAEKPVSQNNLNLSVVSLLELSDNIDDIQVTQDTLYVATPSQGLLTVDISTPSTPQIDIQYPATDILGPFAINHEAAFFAGGHTIASISFLPALLQQREGDAKVKLTIPGNLPLGHYHLSSSDGAASGQRWPVVIPDAINVIRAKTNKPRLTQEDFKKLLKKHQEKHPSKATTD